MATISFLLVQNVVLAGSGAGTLTTQVSPGEALHLGLLVFTSTGAFGVTDVRLSSGRRFTNASTSNYIPSGALQNGASSNIGINYLMLPIDVMGGEILYIDLLDTSTSSNTVRLVLAGTKDTA